MAGFSIILMNFLLIPLVFLAFFAVCAVFAAGAITAVGLIFLLRVLARRPAGRTFYVRTCDPAAVTWVFRGAGVRGARTMPSESSNPSLVKATVYKKDEGLTQLWNGLMAGPGVYDIYVR